MDTSMKICLIIFVLNQFLASADTDVCKISTRHRRDAPYIISIGSCDPTNVQILKADDHSRHAEEDAATSASNVEEIALEGRKSFYGLVTKMLQHIHARIDKSVQRANRNVEEKKIASELRDSSRKKRIYELLDLSKFKNLLAEH